MSPFTRICQAVLILVLTAEAQAKSATEVFESASGSVVVVYGNDVKGKHKSLGSGVVLPGGAVVTNCHVIEKSDRFVVKHQQKEYPAILKHADHDRDVCSLSTEGLKAPAAHLGTTKTLKVGQRVYAIGAPQGLELTLSEGIVSSLREVEGGQYIQTSAPISPGSSGGGLFDEEGRLIGLPTFYLANGQQLNFAVPVEWVKQLPTTKAIVVNQRARAGFTTVEWLNKAIELQNSENWHALVLHAQNWTRNAPREPQAWYMLGIAYKESSQADKAITAYQRSLRINNEDAEVWNNLGSAYYTTKRMTDAIKAFQQALRIHPEDAMVWQNLGTAYIETSQTTKAIEAYKQSLSIDPENALAWNNLGGLYLRKGQTADAVESLQQLLRINPEDAYPWYILGLIYAKAGEIAKAIDVLQRAVQINPQHANAWFNLGICYKLDGQNNRATEVYRQLKTVSPKTAEKFFTNILLLTDLPE